MNRIIIPVTLLLGTSSLLLVDSAIKGTVILLIAAWLAILLRRDSAATRHLVWLVAIVATLAIPLFSVVLPQWQVLPAWMAISESKVGVQKPNDPFTVRSPRPDSIPSELNSITDENYFAHADLPLKEVARAQQIDGQTNSSEIGIQPGLWFAALPIVWAAGVAVLVCRLLAARWLLSRNERNGRAIFLSGAKLDGHGFDKSDFDRPVIMAFEEAHRQLGIRQSVLLLIHPESTIPVIWGIVRCRLLLPEAARQWSGEQLRSVLLHELAHIKRRDTSVQLIAQIACAMHWFNPLVWFASWRLHVERERACDDLVLAQGVFASSYAEHLLNVATKLSVAPWTSACGLAMASHSPLERRLQAILSNRLNRRNVSSALALMGLLIGVSLTIPIAMLCATQATKPEPAANSSQGDNMKIEADFLLGMWHGTLNGERIMLSFHRSPVESTIHSDLYVGDATIGTLLRFEIASDGSVVTLFVPNRDSADGVEYGRLTQGENGTLQLEIKGHSEPSKTRLTRQPDGHNDVPQQKEPRALFDLWKKSSLPDGKIPGAFIGKLSEQVQWYVKANPGLSSSMELPKLLPRFNASRDWTPAEAISLLNDVAYYSIAPIDALLLQSSFPVEELSGEGVVWNDPGDGLLLGYRITGDEWRILGKPLKMELWVQNPGKEDVLFQFGSRPDIGVRMKLKDASGHIHDSNCEPYDNPVAPKYCLLSPGYAIKVKELAISVLWPANDISHGKGHLLSIQPGTYSFHCELDLPGFSTKDEGGNHVTKKDGEWKGTLVSRSLNITVVPPDAPVPKPRIENVNLGISKDGGITVNGKKITFDEFKTRVIKNKQYTIDADRDVPFARVIEVVDKMQAAGVTEFSFSQARVGDGKYRVANRQANYKFDDTHGFAICRPSEHPQFFTVSWPAEGERPTCWLRTYPNVSAETQGKWAVVWEPGTDILWWVDDSDVGKMTLTNPARVIIDREGRLNNFSRDFGLPEEVKTEFRRLGFVIGLDKTPGLEFATGGNTGSQSIVSAEVGRWSIQGTVTDANGKPLENISVRLSTNQELKTVKTNAKGKYEANFSLSLELLAHWRTITVKPEPDEFFAVIRNRTGLDVFGEGGEWGAAKFNALLYEGEQPQRISIDSDPAFQPGPITLTSGRNLFPGPRGVVATKPAVVDFTMVPIIRTPGK